VVWLFVLVPAEVAWINAAYAVAVNVPCVVVTRYNRARIDRVRGRRSGTSVDGVAVRRGSRA
jgi:hypothetical protein